MTAVFVYGPCLHGALLEVVLGRAAVPVAASVRGAVRATRTGATWVDDAGRVTGALLAGLSAEDGARLAFYAGVTGQRAVACTVQSATGEGAAVLYAGGDVAGAWQPDEWTAAFGAATVATAGDIMALYGKADPDRLALRYGRMLARGAARVRAAGGVATLRRAQNAGDVEVAAMMQPYARFFAVEEYDLRFRRFDGSLSDAVNRAGFVMGDAVTVLPYDPLRDRVLLVEQFRAGAYMRGAAQCWSLEAIAGRIDPGETPEDAARREAVEEAGLGLGKLELVGGYYPSPGAVTEYLYSYVALVDLPDGAAGVFGVEGEAEDIRGHLVGFGRLMELVASGEVDNAPLVLTALWLQRERGRLRAGAAGR